MNISSTIDIMAVMSWLQFGSAFVSFAFRHFTPCVWYFANKINFRREREKEAAIDFIVCLLCGARDFRTLSTIFSYLFLYNPIQLWLWNKRNESYYCMTINGFGDNDADTIQNHRCRRVFWVYPPNTNKIRWSVTNFSILLRSHLSCNRFRAD